MADDLETAIGKIVREELKNVKIESVNVKQDFDFDGDAVLRVMIVFSTGREVDAQAAKGLVRHLRSALEERTGEYAFPLISFLSTTDNSRLKSATG